MKQTLLTLTTALLLSNAANAHSSGHDGSVLDTAKHLLSQPDHITAFVAVTAIALVAIYSRVTSKKRR